MKVDVLTVMQDGQPLLPPMSAENGYCLHYVENGVLKGGYSLLCEAPQTPNTVMVRVECLEDVFVQMIDDPALDIQWWQEVHDEEEEAT